MESPQKDGGILSGHREHKFHLPPAGFRQIGGGGFSALLWGDKGQILLFKFNFKFNFSIDNIFSE